MSFFKLTGVFLGVGVGQHKGQLGGGGALAVHPRRGFAHAHRAVLLYQFTVQGEHIAGGDLFAAHRQEMTQLCDRYLEGFEHFVL